MTLLLTAVTGAWADTDPTLNVEFTSSTATSWLKNWEAEGVTLSGSGSFSSSSGYYYGGCSGNAAAVDGYYFGIAANSASTKIVKVSILVSPNNNKTVNPVFVGWTTTPALKNVACHKAIAGTSTSSTKEDAEWITYDLDAEGVSSDIKYIRIYRKISAGNFYESEDAEKSIGDGKDLGAGVTLRIWQVKVWLEDLDTRTASSIAFTTTSGDADIAAGSSYVLPSLTTTPAEATVTYSSSNEAVATVNETTGAVKLTGEGTTIITASFAGNATYKPSSGKFTLNVTNSAAVAFYSWEGADGGATQTGGTIVAQATDGGTDETATVVNQEKTNTNGTYYAFSLGGNSDFSTHVVKITLDNPLKEGDKIKVTGFRMKNDKNKAGGFKAKFNVGESVVASSTGFEFCNIDDTAASDEDSNKGTAPNTCTFDVPDDAAGSTVITMTRSHQSTTLFVSKLEIVRSTETITISAAEWASFSNANELQIPEGVTAYYAQKKDGSTVTLKEITGGYIPANTGVVLSGSEGSYNAAITNTSASLGGENLLQPWLTAGTPTAGTYYTLAVSAGNPVFKKSSGGTLAAGKAYLVMPTSSAELSVDFGESDTEDITTGISAIDNGQLTMDNAEVYNLNGQRVNQPTKGLYIVNGKKVVLK